ncbi:MAG: hypothetical protein GYA20_07445 [Chloroflexi bacterium]|nr:hypothetical protein [Chloroflexota bacterium]
MSENENPMTDLQELRRQLDQVTDEAEFDLILSKIAAVEKQARLAQNRLNAEARAKAEAEREAAIRAHQAGRAKLERERKEAAKEDEAIFADLSALYDRILARHRREIDLYVLADELNRTGAELSQPPVDRPRMRICGVDTQGMDRFEAIYAILTQYHLASCQIVDARKNGVPSPEKPGMDWYGRGDGRFWPKKPGE